MPDKKLTDNEIKKALEYCSKQGITSECEKCKMPKNTCRTELIGYALDLINRQDAENENLSHNNRQMTRDIMGLHKALETAKAENEELKKEVDFLRASKNLNQAEFEELKIELELKKLELKTAKAEAEVERLKKSNRNWRRKVQRLRADLNVDLEGYASEYDNKIKAEAYKECIEKVKETAQDISEGGFKGCYLISKVNLDNLLKELTEKSN